MEIKKKKMFESKHSRPYCQSRSKLKTITLVCMKHFCPQGESYTWFILKSCTNQTNQFNQFIMTHSFLGNKKSWNFHLFSCPPGGNRRRLKAHTLCHRPLSTIVGSGRLATSGCPHPLWVAASAWVLLTSSCPHTWSSSSPLGQSRPTAGKA